MTDRWFVTNSLFPVVWVIAGATLLAGISIWLEWKKNSRFRLIRCFAQLILLLALSLLLIRPAIRTEYDGEHSIILTSNFDRQVADSLIRVYPNAQLKRTAATRSYRDAEVVGSLSQELNESSIVLGDGISLADLDAVPDNKFIYLGGTKPFGITSITHQQPVANQITQLQIGVNAKSDGQLLIKSPGGIEDSTTLAKGRSSSRLNIRPKQPGQFLYSIIIKDGNGSVVDEQPLALDILPEKKLRILILQDYPTSEVRYLKNFLSARGHGLTLRYQLSLNIFRHEFANTEQKKINRIDNETLSEFDLALIDSDILKKMSTSERKQLNTSVRNGLGLLILFNESPQQRKSFEEVLNISFATTKTDTAYVSVQPGTTTMVRTHASTAQPRNGMVPLLQTADKKILSGYSYNGIGKAGFNLLTETYRFIIQGNESTYAALWTPLLSKLSRKQQQQFSINILTTKPFYANEPVSIEILAARGKPTLIADDKKVTLTEDVLIDDRWIGKTWFKESGWHTLKTPEDSTHLNVYVYNENELSSIRITEQQRFNTIRQTSGDVAAIKNASVVYKPVSPAWFFFTILLAAGFLWLAPKL